MARTKKKSLSDAVKQLQALGLSLSNSEVLEEKIHNEEAQREHPKHFRNLGKNREMEAEGALFFLRMNPKQALVKRCRYDKCQQKFMTNYNSISYCGNECRRLDLQQNFAIKWNDQLAEEQWGIYEPGLALPGNVVKVLIQLLERMGYEVSDKRPETRDQSPTLNASEPEGLDQKQNEVPEQENIEKDSSLQEGPTPVEPNLSFLDDYFQ